MEHFASIRDDANHAGQTTGRGLGPRHSILDLAPLELECLSALWPMGEGTVRDIHRQLSVVRPRAYTTVLTIMDRLAQKGIVARRKAGRAYLYQANLSADEARWKAVEKIVAGFFDGSAEALAAHLSTQFPATAAENPADGSRTLGIIPTPIAGVPDYTANRAADTGASRVRIDARDAFDGELLPPGLDETLL